MEGKIPFLSSREIITQLNKHIAQNRQSPAISWSPDDITIQTCTHQQLLERSQRIAAGINHWHEKAQIPLAKNRRIGVWLPRSSDYVVSFLGIWISGCVYVPISDIPIKRLENDSKLHQDFMARLKTIMPELDGLILSSSFLAYLKQIFINGEHERFIATRAIDLNQLEMHVPSERFPVQEVTGSSPAYVYCTSGTTGLPKMIEITYDGIADRFTTVRDMFEVQNRDSILNFTGFDFDPSLMEMLLAFYSGGTLVMVPDSIRRGDISRMGEFYNLLREENIRLPAYGIFLPRVLDLLDPEIFKDSLKGLMTTGEDLTPGKLLRWFATVPGLKTLDGYGPTETTWGATLHRIEYDPAQKKVSPPYIDTPMRGIELQLAKLPEGEEDLQEDDDITKRFPFLTIEEMIQKRDKSRRYEICITGNGLGKYIGHESEKYNKKNWYIINERRYFRTWDSVECKNGHLAFTGRIDRTFKYNGEWVSLKTLEDKIKEYSAVRDVIAIRYRSSYLVCMLIVFKEEMKQVAYQDLYSLFKNNKFAPRYFFQIDRVPINSRQKTSYRLEDYAKCNPQLIQSTKTTSTLDNKEEECLAALWRDLLIENLKEEFNEICKVLYNQDNVFDNLAVDFSYPIASHTKFFELGGSSLHMMRLTNLLWSQYIEKKVDKKKARASFREGILDQKLQSLANMSKFIKLYLSTLLTPRPLETDEIEAPCFVIQIGDSQSKKFLEQFNNTYFFQANMQELQLDNVWQETWARLIAAEIREIQSINRYLIVFIGKEETIAKIIYKYLEAFLGSGIEYLYCENAELLTFQQHLLKFEDIYYKKALALKLMQGTRSQEASQSIKLRAEQYLAKLQTESKICLHGTACGKTATLKLMHEISHKQDKMVCYISCQQLSNTHDNLKQYLKLPKQLNNLIQTWNDQEIYWFIDHVESSAADLRLSYLIASIRKLPGQHFFIFAARQWFDSIIPMEDLCVIDIFERPAENEIKAWFETEQIQSGVDMSAFKQQLYDCFVSLYRNTYTPRSNFSWWGTTNTDIICNANASLPLYAIQYPAFASLSLFMERRPSSNQSGYLFNFCYPERLRIEEAINSLPARIDAVKITDEYSSTLPEWIKLLTPHTNHLSPWILFHPITGELPNYYQALADKIYAYTQQPVYAVCLPSNSSEWNVNTLEEQVSYYLKATESLIPHGGERYYLGWSYGGFLAYEAARQSELHHRPVKVVVNLDAAPILFEPNFDWKKYTISVITVILERQGKNELAKEFLRQIANKQPTSIDAIIDVAKGVSQSGKISLDAFEGLRKNLKLLFNYCRTLQIKEKLVASYFIIEAEEKIQALEITNFDKWNNAALNAKLFSYYCDHFSLFDQVAINSKLEIIVTEHGEQVDKRPLSQRLMDDTKKRWSTMFNLLTEKYIETELDDKITNLFLKQESTKCLIIEGGPGYGKTSLVTRTAITLFGQLSINLAYSENQWLPIIITMRNHPREKDIEQILLQYGFLTRDFRSTSNSERLINLLLIFDGCDEIDFKDSWLKTLLEMPLRVKIIFTIRESVQNRVRLIRLLTNSGNEPLVWSLKPFSDKQCESWLQSQTDINESKTTSFRKIFELHEWLKTPLMLGMLYKTYERWKDLSIYSLNPIQLFALFESELIEDAYQNLTGATQGINLDQLKLAVRNYCHSLAAKLYLNNHQDRTLSLWQNNDFWTQRLKAIANVSVKGTSLDFAHFTWREFYIARFLLERLRDFNLHIKPEENGDGQQVICQLPFLFEHLNTEILLQSEYLMFLLVGYWHNCDKETKEKIKANLYNFIYLSRCYLNSESDFARKIAKLAGLSLSLLNLFGVNLAELNFADIYTDHADLSGNILTDTNYSRAKMLGTDLSNSALINTCFKEAKLPRLKLNCYPTLSGQISCFSSDGKHLVIADSYKVLIYLVDRNLSSINLVMTLDPKIGRINQLAISSSNQLLCSGDYRLSVVNLSQPEKQQIIEISQKIKYILFRPDGRQLAICCAYKIIYLYDTSNLRKPYAVLKPIKAVLPTVSSAVTSYVDANIESKKNTRRHTLAYHSTNNLLAAVFKNQVYIWDSNSLALNKVLNEDFSTDHAFNKIYSIAFHPKLDYLAAQNFDLTLIWDSRTWELVQRKKKHIHAAQQDHSPGRQVIEYHKHCPIAFNPNQVSMGFVDTVKKYAFYELDYARDNSTRNYQIEISFLLNINFRAESFSEVQLAYTKDGEFIAYADDSFVYLANLRNDKFFKIIGKTLGPITKIEFHPTNLYLTVDYKDGTIILYSLDDKRFVQHQMLNRNQYVRSNVSCFQVLPLRNQIAFSRGTDVYLLTLQTFELEKIFSAPDRNVIPNFSLSKDCTHIAYHAGLFDLSIGVAIPGFSYQPGLVAEDHRPKIIFHSQGKLFISPSTEGFCLYDFETKQPIRQLKSGAEIIDKKSFSPDGKMLVTKGYNILYVYNLNRNDVPPLIIARDHPHSTIPTIAFRHDSKQLAAWYFKTIFIYDLEDGKCLNTIKMALEHHCIFQYRPVSNELFAVSHSDEIKIYDSNTVKLVGRLHDPDSSFIEGLNFTSDGKYLASLHNHSYIQIWDTQSLKRVARLYSNGHLIDGLWFEPLQPHNDSEKSYYVICFTYNNLQLYRFRRNCIPDRENDTYSLDLVWKPAFNEFLICHDVKLNRVKDLSVPIEKRLSQNDQDHVFPRHIRFPNASNIMQKSTWFTILFHVGNNLLAVYYIYSMYRLWSQGKLLALDIQSISKFSTLLFFQTVAHAYFYKAAIQRGYECWIKYYFPYKPQPSYKQTQTVHQKHTISAQEEIVAPAPLSQQNQSSRGSIRPVLSRFDLNTLLGLPIEILIEVTTKLNYLDYIRLASTCRTLNQKAHSAASKMLERPLIDYREWNELKGKIGKELSRIGLFSAHQDVNLNIKNLKLRPIKNSSTPGQAHQSVTICNSNDTALVNYNIYLLCGHIKAFKP